MQRVEQCIDVAGVRYVQMDVCVCARKAICMCGETLSAQQLVSHNIHNRDHGAWNDVRCKGYMRRESSSSSLRCRRPDTRYADTLLGCMQSGAVEGWGRRQSLNSCSRNSVGVSGTLGTSGKWTVGPTKETGYQGRLPVYHDSPTLPTPVMYTRACRRQT